MITPEIVRCAGAGVVPVLGCWFALVDGGGELAAPPVTWLAPQADVTISKLSTNRALLPIRAGFMVAI